MNGKVSHLGRNSILSALMMSATFVGGTAVAVEALAEVRGVEATYNVTRSDGTQMVREGTYRFLEGDAGLLVSAPTSGSPTNTYIEYIYFAGVEYFSQVKDSPAGGRSAHLRYESLGFLRPQSLLREALLGGLRDEYEPGTPINHRNGVTKIVSDTTRSEDGINVRKIEAEYFFNVHSDHAAPVAIEIRWAREDRGDRVISHLFEDGNQSVLYTYSDIRPPSDEMLAIYSSGGIPIGMKVQDSRESGKTHFYAWTGEPQPFTGITYGMKVGLTLTVLAGLVVIGSAWLIRNFFVRLDGAERA